MSIPSHEEMALIEAKLQGAWNNILYPGRTSIQPVINAAYVGGVQLYLCKYCKGLSIASRKAFDDIWFRYVNSRNPSPEELRFVGEAYNYGIEDPNHWTSQFWASYVAQGVVSATQAQGWPNNGVTTTIRAEQAVVAAEEGPVDKGRDIVVDKADNATVEEVTKTGETAATTGEDVVMTDNYDSGEAFGVNDMNEDFGGDCGQEPEMKLEGGEDEDEHKAEEESSEEESEEEDRAEEEVDNDLKYVCKLCRGHKGIKHLSSMKRHNQMTHEGVVPDYYHRK